jgi:hypothetical protein
MDRDIEVIAKDALGERILSFPCRRTETGWINAELKIALAPSIEIAAWREWRYPKSK